jgi:flagellar biosynthetic protein FliR
VGAVVGTSLFDFSQEEMLSFFAVLVRFSVLMAILPFVGDKVVPTPVKILLSLSITIALFPMLVARGNVNPAQAAVWGASAGGILGTISLEVLCALVLGYTARLGFEAVQFGGNLVGTFMGFSTAAQYDPHQESQTQVVAQIQMAIAMLLFLALDGHHLMLRASLESYRIVGIGGLAGFVKTGMNGGFAQKIIELSGEVIKFGLQLAAPVAVCMFAVNVVFGVLAKAMPQLNVLVLSFAVTALIGLAVMLLTVPEFQGAVTNIFSLIGEWMNGVLLAMAKGH